MTEGGVVTGFELMGGLAAEEGGSAEEEG